MPSPIVRADTTHTRIVHIAAAAQTHDDDEQCSERESVTANDIDLIDIAFDAAVDDLVTVEATSTNSQYNAQLYTMHTRAQTRAHIYTHTRASKEGCVLPR